MGQVPQAQINNPPTSGGKTASPPTNNRTGTDKKTASSGFKKFIDELNSLSKTTVSLDMLKGILHKAVFKKILFFFGITVLILAVVLVIIMKNKNKFIQITEKITQGSEVQTSTNWSKIKIPQREQPFFKLDTTVKRLFGILPQESLQLTVKNPIDTEFITGNLESSVPVDVIPVNPTVYEIKPKSALELNQALRIKLNAKSKISNGHTFDRNYSWVFQSQEKFKIVSTLPGDKKTNVPVTTGIEFVFNQDNFQNPEKFIEIKPQIEYKTEIHRETLAIVPQKQLKPKTVYTVTLKKGLNLSGRDDPISQDFSFSFQTSESESQPVRLNVRENLIQVSPTDPVQAKVYTTNNFPADSTIQAEIYKFPDLEKFLESRRELDEITGGWMSYYAEEKSIPTDGIPQISKADLKIQTNENVTYLQLPETLTAGYYMVKFFYDNRAKQEQLWVQSSDLTAYASVGKEQTVIWSNSLRSGQTGQVTITVPDNNLSVTSDENGVAVFQTPSVFFEKKMKYINVTDRDNSNILIPVKSLESYDKPGQTISHDYWSYIYNERIYYKPTDKVHFWGVVKKRDTNLPPDIITVAIGSSYWEYSSASKTKDLKAVNVVPQADGTFTGEIELSDFPTGWYSLTVQKDGLVINSAGIQVMEYEKPEMTIDITADKKAIFAGDNIRYSVKVNFFDGTPASKIPLKLYESDNNKNENIKTDFNGQYQYTYKSEYKKDHYYYPRYESITVNPSLTQNNIVEGFGSVNVYGSSLMLTTKTNQNGPKAEIKATVNKVNLDPINQGTSSDVRGPAVPNQKIKITITKEWWEKKEEGSYYDFIEKETRPKYQYFRKTETVFDDNIVSDPNGEISKSFQMEDRKSYSAILQVSDDGGRVFMQNEYFYYYSGSSYYANQKPTASLDLMDQDNDYSLGEQVNLNIMADDDKFPNNDKNRFLFIQATRGRQEASVLDRPEYSFIFEEKHKPNIYIGAVIFNGKYYQDVSANCKSNWYCNYNYYYGQGNFDGLQVNYQTQDSELKIEIKAGKPEYMPGAQAQITVTVKNKDGFTVDGADVNIALVDQALVAIGGARSPSPISSLYRTIPDLVYYNYKTHQPLFPDPNESERGGGGGDRELFKDTAYFGQTRTNSNGEAVFTFTLPDNITTWVIYGQAVSGNLDAGHATNSITVTKDFFVTNHFPSEIILDDRATVTASSYGDDLSETTPINYENIFYLNDTEIHSEKQTGKKSESVVFPFPELEIGNYTISVRGSISGYEDGVRMPLKVIDSRLIFEDQILQILKKGDQINRIDAQNILSSQPVRFIISDLGKGIYFQPLSRYCNVYSNRIEKYLAKKVAREVLINRFDDVLCDTPDELFQKYQNFDGGIAQVSWGSSDLLTSAWSAYVHPKVFDRPQLVNYFQNNLINSPVINQIYAAWGLSNLDQPKVPLLQRLSEQSADFREKVFAAIALASLGETEQSREIYYNIMADYAYENKPYIRIQSPELNKPNQYAKTVSNEDRQLFDTSLVLLLGVMTGADYNLGMHTYLKDYRNQAEDIILDISDMLFIEEEMKRLPDENTALSFTSRGSTQTRELKNGKSEIITLENYTGEDFKLVLTEGKGEVGINYFVGPEGLNKLTKDNRLKIKRTYKKVVGDGDQLHPGDIISVQIDFDLNYNDAPLGYYTITDYLPSGLQLLKNPYNYGLSGHDWVYYQQDNQIVTSGFTNSPWWQSYGNKSIIYYARVNAAGTYIAEPAILQSGWYLSVFQTTPIDKIEIVR